MITTKKITVLLIVPIVLVIMAICIWMLVPSKEVEKSNNMNIKELYNINIYGTQGEGYVHIELNEGYFEAYIIESGISITKEDVAVNISKENNLQNGDTFNISFVDKDKLNDKGVRLQSDTATYTVSGLKEGTDFDVFKDLIIVLDEGVVMIDNSMCSNFIKDNVEFFIKNQLESYKEGDTVTVGAYVDMNAATDNGYNIKKTEQKFIISEQEMTND